MEAEKLIGIERKLWTNNAAYYKEALLVFPETGVITRDAAVRAILAENLEDRKWAEVHFHHVRTVWIAHHAALLNYRVAARWENEPDLISALATSIYVEREPLGAVPSADSCEAYKLRE